MGHFLAHLLRIVLGKKLDVGGDHPIAGWCMIVLGCVGLITIAVKLVLPLFRRPDPQGEAQLVCYGKPGKLAIFCTYLLFVSLSVLFICGGAAIVQDASAPSDPERAAKAIERHHGILKRDDKAADRPIIRVAFNGQSLSDSDLGALKKHLEALPELQELDLVDTNVTDRGLPHLKSLKQLRKLQLGRIVWALRAEKEAPTPGGVKELQQALPDTEIQLHQLSKPSHFDPRIFQRVNGGKE